MLVAGAAGIFISAKNDATGPNIYPILIPLVALLLIFGIYRGIKRQKILYDTYRLTLEGNFIKREQINTPTVTLYLNDVQYIKKQRSGGFILSGKNANDKIMIPAQIEKYGELETALNQIKTIDIETHKPLLQKYQGLFSLFVVGLMVCVFTVANKLIVAVSGVIVVAVLIWGFVEIRKSKNIDLKTKRASWYIILVLISIAAIIYYKLSGGTTI